MITNFLEKQYIYSIISIGDVMKYPGGIKQQIVKNINYGNRGTGLENDINITNQYYRDIKSDYS